MKLKEKPEDFVVEEILSLKIEEGPYHYYKVRKTNWNTLDLIRELKMRLRVKDVGYAGLKDKRAVTTQHISVGKKIPFTIPGVTLEYLGTGKQRIYLGMLEGNKFTLTVRDLDEELQPIKEIVNLYGEQRFSDKNARLGKCLVQKNFAEACALLKLEVKDNDYVGALKKHGMHLLKIYVMAYQSLLWNKLALESEEDVLPILGFLTEEDVYDTVMQEEGISKKDFQLRSIPGLAAEGGERQRVVKVKDFKTLSFEKDELHEGKMKQVIQFSLPKGAYATEVVRQMAQLLHIP